MKPDLAARPRVTLVVAMRNEGSNIERCLASVASQDYPPDLLEVLVYDGESTDDSMALAHAFAAGRRGWAVRTNTRRIQAAAWNAGIQAASGEIVGIVSGHAELAPAYVRSAIDALDRMRADIVGGPVRAVADTPIGAAIAIATSTPYGVGGARHHYLTEPAYVDTVFMGVARREIWLRHPFNEEFVRNQDDELSYRLLDAGGRILCDPAIESWYRSRPTLRALWRQYSDYGCWKVRVLQAHPRQTRIRHLVPLGLVTTLGAGAILSVASRKARVGTALALGVYGVTTAGAAAHYRDRKSPLSAALLAATFPVMHFAYGIGMLRGMWRFRHSFGWAPRATRHGVSGARRQAASAMPAGAPRANPESEM